MEIRDASSHERNTDRAVQGKRLPYRIPVLVEYGNVSKLTKGVGSRGVDANTRSGRVG
jgi:hypothetical protein